MKLTELKPKWMMQITEDNRLDCKSRHGMGIVFDCPVHRNHRLGIFFKNPIDGLPAAEGQLLWQRTGESFDKLTVSPSVDASQFIGCWHGHIVKGEVT